MKNLQQFSELIEAYVKGDCPSEILIDYALELGVDVDATHGGSFYGSTYGRSIRDHFPLCSKNEYDRETCSAIEVLRRFARNS